MNRVTIGITLSILFLSSPSVVAGDIKGKVKVRGVKHAGDAVVYIDNIEGKTFNSPNDHAKMDQKNLTFIPHVLPILVGTTVDFLNSDEVLHNVFSPDKCADKFNLGTWPKGQIRSYTFNNHGCIPVMLCNVHPEMEAYVVVLQSPYYGVSARDGSYEIKNVPPGKYELKIWHEKLKGSSVNVNVPEDGDAVVDFELKR